MRCIYHAKNLPRWIYSEPPKPNLTYTNLTYPAGFAGRPRCLGGTRGGAGAADAGAGGGRRSRLRAGGGGLRGGRGGPTDAGQEGADGRGGGVSVGEGGLVHCSLIQMLITYFTAH